MKCVYILQVMFKNYIKYIVNKINHSLHCYFVVCWLLSEIMDSHKNGTGVYPTSYFEIEKNKCCWFFTLKIKLSHDRRSFQFALDNAVWGNIPLFGIYLVKRRLTATIFFVKFNVIQTNVNRGTQVYLSSCPCKYLFTLIDSSTFVLYNKKTTTPLTWPVKYSLRTSPL